MANDWIVVETLDEHRSPTVVSDGGQRKNWSNPRRARLLVGSPTADAVEEVIGSCRDAKAAVETPTPGIRGSADHMVRGVPIFGPSNVVHGVHVWVGGVDETPPPTRTVCGWVWDGVAERGYQGPGVEELIMGIPPDQVRASRTAADNFRHIVRFDDRIGYVGLAMDIEGGGEWQGEVTMLGADGVARQIQMVGRAIPDKRVINGLFHDLTDVSPPTPALDSTTLRMTARAVGGVGLLALHERFVYDWLAAPVPPLDRWVPERPIIEPDDDRALEEICRQLIEGRDDASLTFRVKFSDTDWIPVAATLTTVERMLAPQALIQVSVAPQA